MKRFLAFILILVLCVTAFAACGQSDGTTDGAQTPTDGTDGGAAASGGKDVLVCMSSDPETLDPALNASVDGSIMLTNAFAGLYGYTTDADGKLVIVPDCAEAIVEPTELEDGKYEYVFKLRDGLLWSDGDPLKPSDFAYAWNRAVDPATMADYQFIFDVIDGYDAETPNLNITADDAANTFTVVTASYCAYFDQLMAHATYFPVKQEIVEANGETWATTPATYVSNGAFKLTEWNVGSSIRFEKNENYWDAGSVKLDSVTFALSDDDDANFANFENGTYHFVRNVSVSQIPTLKETRLDDDFLICDYIGTYFLEFNVEYSFKPGLTAAGNTADAWAGWTAEQNAQVRYALGLLIDRNYIVDEITAAGELPAYGFVPAGMDDGTGSEFRDKADAWWSVAAADYEANCDAAVEILKQWYDYDEASGKFTNFPTFEYSINPTSNNIAICAAIQNIWSDYGIETTIDQRTWAVIQTALTEGDFTMSRLGWIADYNDPINFLEIYVAASGNNHPRLGKDGSIGSGAVYGPDNNQTWADAYESLISGIKTTADPAARSQLMYQAETVLRDTYAVLPVYYYTQPVMCSPALDGIIISPLGWISFKYTDLNG